MREANPYSTVVVATGISHMRNFINVYSADGVIVVIYNVPSVPRPVGYRLHKLLISGKAETGTGPKPHHIIHLSKRLHSSS
jgi:hypothetical protein